MSKTEKKYEHRNPFLQLVDILGETYLRVRQATEQGYADCPVNGCVDLSYPSSPYRRARVIGGGEITNALNTTAINYVFVQL